MFRAGKTQAGAMPVWYATKVVILYKLISIGENIVGTIFPNVCIQESVNFESGEAQSSRILHN